MEFATHESLKIKIDNYSGPLEVLLDLAKSQKVDLTNISITQLADQFIDFINNQKSINLEIASEYLLMATWLAYLKSHILLPVPSPDEHSTEDMGKSLIERLQALESMRDAGSRIIARPLLDRDVFARGIPEDLSEATQIRLDATLYDLLTTYAGCLSRSADSPLRFEVTNLFSVKQALDRLASILRWTPDWQS